MPERLECQVLQKARYIITTINQSIQRHNDCDDTQRRRCAVVRRCVFSTDR